MRVIADFALVPIGVGTSLSAYVAACHRVLQELGVDHQLHANGTNIQGEWEEVFGAIRRCHEVVHELGAPRVSTNVRVGTRSDRLQSMADKIGSVQSKLDPS